MARTAERKNNEKLAPKRKIDAFRISRVLYFIGKPVYFLLSRIIIAAAFLLYITGHSFRVLCRMLGLSVLILLKILLKGLISFSSSIKTVKKHKRVKRVFLWKILSAFFKTSRLSSLKLKLALLKLVKKVPSLPKLKVRFIPLYIILFLIILLPLLFLFFIFYQFPSPKRLNDRQIAVSTKIYDRNGILLYNIYKDKNRTLISLKDVPLHVRLATLAAEDAEFYYHPGFSIKGITRSIIRNFTKGELTGGSTITQQLVKNALLTPEKTLIRKIREVILAILVEMTYSKDEILEMYLNEVSYGGTAYGIKEASYTYFGKDVNRLSLAEAAVLAGLPKSPTKYSPFGTNPELTFARQKDVLNLMYINGFITQEDKEQALKDKVEFTKNKIDIKAPHFVMYIRQILEEKYGKEVVETGGLKVITTLDYQIQTLAEKAIIEEVAKLRNLNVGNGAGLVLDPKNGEILAMVGSKDYFDTFHDGNVNVTLALRQPGSSIKVVNYAYALSSKYTLASILSDTPITYYIDGQPDYTPRNYDGAFRGNLTLRSALAESRNVPAVKVLASYGVKEMLIMGQKMGITTWEEESRYGLSLTLGGGEIKLIDLASVYATLANYGKKTNISSLLSVTNYQGKELYKNGCQENTTVSQVVYAAEAMDAGCRQEQVLDPRIAFLITDVLRDNLARSPAFGSTSSLVIPGHNEVAVKTGTSNNLRDNLTLGYTQNYVVAIWVGNNDNSPMARVASGVTGASPIFNKIMRGLLSTEESKEWEAPAGLVKLPICPLTATLACEGCPVKMEWFLEENKPDTQCSPQFVQSLNQPRYPPQVLEPAAAIEVRN